MRKLIAASLLMISVVACGPALAKNQGKLPKGATPMATDDVRKVYSGNSVDFKVAKYYFAPDGSLVGLGNDAFADGSWGVNGNEFCLNSKWHGKDKASAPSLFDLCYTYFKSGKKTWTTVTKGEAQYIGDTNDGELKKIRKGNIIGDKADKMKAKYGY